MYPCLPAGAQAISLQLPFVLVPFCATTSPLKYCLFTLCLVALLLADCLRACRYWGHGLQRAISSLPSDTSHHAHPLLLPFRYFRASCSTHGALLTCCRCSPGPRAGPHVPPSPPPHTGEEAVRANRSEMGSKVALHVPPPSPTRTGEAVVRAGR